MPSVTSTTEVRTDESWSSDTLIVGRSSSGTSEVWKESSEVPEMPSGDVPDGNNNNLRLFKTSLNGSKFSFFGAGGSKSRRGVGAQVGGKLVLTSAGTLGEAEETIGTKKGLVRQTQSSVDLAGMVANIRNSIDDVFGGSGHQNHQNNHQVDEESGGGSAASSATSVDGRGASSSKRYMRKLYLDLASTQARYKKKAGASKALSSDEMSSYGGRMSSSSEFFPGGMSSVTGTPGGHGGDFGTPTGEGGGGIRTPPKTAPAIVVQSVFEEALQQEERKGDRSSKISTSSASSTTSSNGSSSAASGVGRSLFGRRKKKRNKEQVCASDLGSGGTTTNGLGGIDGEEHGVLIAEATNNRRSVVNGGLLPVTSGLPAFTDTSDSEGETLPVVVALVGTGTDVDDAPLLCLEIPVCPVSHSVGRMVTEAVIPTDVNNLFTLLFTKSKFFQDFHTSRKTFDILQSDWRKSSDGSQNVRQVSFTVSLNHAMGPKHTQVTETQVMLPVSKPGVMYAIDVESVNAGIPYADSFYVQTHFCMTRQSAQETKLCVINQIKYRKSVFSLTKGFIERNTWAGLEEFYTSLEKALKEECTRTCVTAPPTPASARSAPGSRRTGRKKYPAPSIPSASPNRSIGSELCKSPMLVNGVVNRSIDTSTTSSQTQAESSKVLKIILAVLGVLLVMNAFLYVKLTGFESSKPQVMFSSSLSLSKNVPKNQKEWVSLLQQQEELHQLELQKWHEMLITSLKSLHQAEEDLESLKFHITSYNTGRHSVSALTEAIDELHESSPANAHNSVDHQQVDRLPEGLRGSVDEEKVEL